MKCARLNLTNKDGWYKVCLRFVCVADAYESSLLCFTCLVRWSWTPPLPLGPAPWGLGGLLA